MSESEKIAIALNDIFSQAEWKERDVVLRYATVTEGQWLREALVWLRNNPRNLPDIASIKEGEDYEVEIVVRKQ